MQALLPVYKQVASLAMYIDATFMYMGTLPTHRDQKVNFLTH